MNTAIKCGNCKVTHGSVMEVKTCYAQDERPVTPIVQEDELLPCEAKAIATGKVNAPALASVKQVEFILKLQDERNCLSDRKEVEMLTKQNASLLIEALLAMPKPKERLQEASEQPVAEGHALVTAGYYAIDIDGTVKFYRIDKPTEGKWAGYTFVKVQASDEFHPIKNRETKATILATISAQGVKESQARYGQLIGKCGICGRTLTDETSRAFGIGPVCREGF